MTAKLPSTIKMLFANNLSTVEFSLSPYILSVEDLLNA